MALNDTSPEETIVTSNQPVQIDLEYTADRKSVMRLVALIGQDGRLWSDEMYGYAKERADEKERLTLYPFVLIDMTGEHRWFQAEWGNDDPTATLIDFKGRPLAVGHEVERVDTFQGQDERSVYSITSIRPWRGIAGWPNEN